MTKYDVWVSVYDEYKITVEADSLEHMTDVVHANVDQYMVGSNWIDGDLKISHYEEVHDA